MTDKPDKWVEAITKLIKLTQAGELKWSVDKADRLKGREDLRIETVFLTKHKDRNLRLYKYSYLVDDPGPFAAYSYSSLLSGKPPKYPYWSSSIALELIDEEGWTLWTFPQNYALNDLFKAVQYQVAGVDGFLKEILEG